MNKFLFGISKNKVHFISFTAILLGLTIALQFLSSLFGQQLITGSVVNMMLLLNTLFVGVIGAIIVGALTPLIGFFIGMAQSIILVPFIMVANIIYVVLFSYLSKLFDVYNKKTFKQILLLILEIIISGLIKFSFMYFIELKLIIPLIFVNVPKALANAFGILQLLTSLIGGTLFIVLFRILKRINKPNYN